MDESQTTHERPTHSIKQDQEDKENEEIRDHNSPDSLGKNSFLKDYLSDSHDELEDNDGKSENGNETERTNKRNKHGKKGHHDGEKGRSDKSKKKTSPRRPEMSTKWKNLRLFQDENSDDEVKKEKERKIVQKPKQVRQESNRRTTNDEQRTSVGTRMTDYSESSSESEDEDDRVMDGKVQAADLPSEYWQIQKLVKFLKIGNQTATVIALCALSDFNLSQEMCQMAIRDVGGLHVLVNLLKTDCDKCKIGALKILQPLSTSSKYNREAIINLGGIQVLVDLITSGRKEIQSLAAVTIANIAKSSKARNLLRRCGGIRKLVKLLNYQGNGTTTTRRKQMKPQTKHDLDLEVARGAALALWSCSKSVHSRSSIFRAGSVPLLARLVKEDKDEFLIPVVGLVQECAVETRYRQAFQRERIMEDIVRHLTTENEELQTYCASAIFRCAEDEDTRKVVRQFGGLEPLVRLLSCSENKKLLASATGAVWKCAVSPENAKRFLELNVLETLIGFLQSESEEPEEVQIHVVGAIGELAKEPKGKEDLLRFQGCKTLVELLNIPNDELRANVAKALAACAEARYCRRVINNLDGLRLLWSLMKLRNQKDNPRSEKTKKVVANSAWAVYQLMEDTPEACETARSFVGGFELIVGLLKSEDVEILRGACAAISNIATDQENVGVLTDYGVVQLLAGLTYKTDPELRRYVAEAISRCCTWGSNASDFCRAGAVEQMVDYLSVSDPLLHRSAVIALHELAKTPQSCIIMHERGVVKFLVQMVGSDDEALQDAAAGCLSNIRKLAMANEKEKQEAKRKRAIEKKAINEKKKKEDKGTSERNGRESTGSHDSYRSEEFSYIGEANDIGDRSEEATKGTNETTEPHKEEEEEEEEEEERSPSPAARDTRSV